jgi:hypothetical protein
VRDLRHQAAYLFGAVCPERDAGVALVLPAVGSAAMQAMLDETLSRLRVASSHPGERIGIKQVRKVADNLREIHQPTV